ncbi:hypothetical protein Tco_0026955 [Tanacetum coccineum]
MERTYTTVDHDANQSTRILIRERDEDMFFLHLESYQYNKDALVKSVSVKKLHGYGHLEEMVVKELNRQFYKFKEGDFIDLQLNEIEDMLLLAVQHKLFHLIGSDIVDFIVALRMFTRSLVIKKCVEDLQLGVESYQKKLNITPPQQTFPKIEFKELYTPSHKPPRMPRRKWMAIDRKRSELMVEMIDKQMRERRIIRNLENRLFGGSGTEMGLQTNACAPHDRQVP